MKGYKIGVFAVVVVIAVFLSGCVPNFVIIPSSAFRTARVLERGEKRMSIRGFTVIPTALGFELGLPWGMQLYTGLNAFHGQSKIEGDLQLWGPEAYLTKNWLNLGNILYISTSIGGQVFVGIESDVDKHSSAFGFLAGGSLDLGVFPVKWFGIYTLVEADYLYFQWFNEGKFIADFGAPAFLWGAGIELSAEHFDVRIGYKTPIGFDLSEILTISLDGGFIPYAGIEIGFKF
jgi:hypothetical protein